MAASPDISDKAKPGSGDVSPSRTGGQFNAIAMLRLLLIATILVPLVLGVIAADISYRHDLEQAKTSALEAVAVETENTAKVLDTHILVAARIDDMLGAMTDDQIRSQEKQLHDRIAAQIGGMPEVAA